MDNVAMPYLKLVVTTEGYSNVAITSFQDVTTKTTWKQFIMMKLNTTMET